MRVSPPTEQRQDSERRDVAAFTDNQDWPSTSTSRFIPAGEHRKIPCTLVSPGLPDRSALRGHDPATGRDHRGSPWSGSHEKIGRASCRERADIQLVAV